MRSPKLKTVEKYRPLFPLNHLPSDFAIGVGREAVYHLTTRTAAILFSESEFKCEWNKRKNLKAYNKKSGEHNFTWQPHGSQFTIVGTVPDNRLAIRIKQPPYLNQDDVLKALNFDASWIEIISECVLY